MHGKDNQKSHHGKFARSVPVRMGWASSAPIPPVSYFIPLERLVVYSAVGRLVFFYASNIFKFEKNLQDVCS